MKPEAVVLTKEQKLKVVLQTLDTSTPWKQCLAYFSIVALNYYLILPFLYKTEFFSNIHKLLLDLFLSYVVMPVMESISVGVILLILNIAYIKLFVNFKYHFRIHRESLQREILDSVDEEILK